MEFFHVINNRRSCRSFLPDEIPERILEKILEAGRQAPSGGNAQNNYFGVIRDKKQKEKLAEAAGGQEWICSAPVIIALCTDISRDRARVNRDDFGLIVDCTRFGEVLVNYLNRFPNRKEAKIFWENANCLLPGEHIFLAAVNFGLQGCWIGYLDIKKAGEILNLPDDMACHFLMPIGYPKELSLDPGKKTLSETVFLICGMKNNFPEQKRRG